MNNKMDLKEEAKALPYDFRKDCLLKQEETTLHKYLCSLLNRLDGLSAEVTHGKDEFGRDLVVKQKDDLGNQYIAVIVKKGNIKGEITGETAGEVEEIISQARQSILHPCPLHELYVTS